MEKFLPFRLLYSYSQSPADPDRRCISPACRNLINIAELFVFGQLELVNTGELLKPVGLLEIFFHHFEMGFVDFFPVNL